VTTCLDDRLRAAVADEDRLYAAWLETRARLNEEGPLTGAALDIERDLGATLRRLSDELRHDRWVPSPLARFTLTKDDGTDRVLRVPPVADRVVERSLLSVIAPVLDPLLSPWSFAYRQGIRVLDALAALARFRDSGLRHVVRTDFDDCFDRINRTRLLDRLADEIPSSWLIDVVSRLITRPDQGKAGHVPGGIPQGAPLSPLLCNLYLDEFDQSMAARGIDLVRYADDVTLVARSRTAAEEAAEAARAGAGDLDMALNEEKTIMTTFDEGFFFLGEEIGPTHPVLELAAVANGEQLRKTLYVTRTDTHVTVSKGQFVVRTYDDDVLLRAPLSMVGHVVLCGPVGLSAGARSAALYEGIEVTILSLRGRWLGRLDGGQLKRADVRRQQYRAGDDIERRALIARGFVVGKIDNMRALLMRYRRRHATPQLVGATNHLRELRRAVLRCESLEQIRGFEGAATKSYFGAFGSLLPDDAGFQGRVRRPPTDPANATLSYSYAVLQGEITSALATAGLDPVAGFLHLDHDNRPSLTLDLMEEFRPLVVDATVVDLFRRRALGAEHFRDLGTEAGIRLTDPGRRRLLEGLERRMLTVFHHAPSDRRVTYRRAFLLQAQHLVAVLTGEADDYQPVPWR